jgi:hypothetical protein
LRAYGVFGCAVEGLDAQVLLDLLEEQFNLLAATIELRKVQCRQFKIVSEDGQSLACFKIAERQATELLGIGDGRLFACEDDGLVADEATRCIDGVRIEPAETVVKVGETRKPTSYSSITVNYEEQKRQQSNSRGVKVINHRVLQPTLNHDPDCP